MTSSGNPPSTPPELVSEQAYLDQVREVMATMRDEALHTFENVYAEDDWTHFNLQKAMWERAQSLLDDGRTAPFFGRLEGRGVAEHWGSVAAVGQATQTEGEHEQWYIGRRHIGATAERPLVIDWRAPVSMGFYRATPEDPGGVTTRRRYGFDRGAISAFEDEDLTAPAPTGHSALLAAEIERPRVGPMRDIVATIQPEQDALVRLDHTTTVCIQGAPGTGKTAVGLHRIAWLLYAHQEYLSRTGVLVIGPNAAFLEHIGSVLPALGEIRVRHTTVDALVAGEHEARGVDSAERATLLGDVRMAELLRRAVWDRFDPTTVAGRGQRIDEACAIPRGSRTWRVPAYRVRELVAELAARGLRYEAARQLLPQRLAHDVVIDLERAGLATDDRTLDSLARTAPVKKYCAGVWPQLTASKVLHGLLSSVDAITEASRGLLTDDEVALLTWDKAPHSPGVTRWTPAELVLLDELEDLLNRTPSLGHVMLDEAQDLSPMQLRAVGRRCASGAATVLGDIAQGTTPWATASWDETLHHLGHDGAHVEELRRGYRVPASVIEYAARLLPLMAPGLVPPEAVRSNRGVLRVLEADDVAAAAVRELTREGAAEGSVGIIVPDAEVEAYEQALTQAGVEHGQLTAESGDVEHRIDVVPATVAKGLEFDRVLVVEPAAIAAAEPDERTGLRRLYVVLTRAVSELTVLHRQALPAALR